MLKLDPYALTDVGRRRDHNEDYLGDLIFRSGRRYGPEKLNERGYLFAVADGMGGHASGEVASEMAITTLFERYYNGPSSGDAGSDLLEAVKEANIQVHRTGISNGRGQMGTTLTLALIIGNRVIVGNVGDSRTYLIRQGLPLRVTHDHSLVQEQIDMGILSVEQAEQSSIRNVITRAVGHRDNVEPDLFEQELQQGDILLLCSDGLHGAVREDELGPIVSGASSLDEAAHKLVNLSNERGGVDNISVLLVAVTQLGEPISPILNNRAAYYPPPRQAMTEKVVTPTRDFATDRLKISPNIAAAPKREDDDSGEITKYLDRSNVPTVPNLVPVEANLTAAAPARTTRKFPASTEPEVISTPTPARSGKRLWLLLLLVALIATAAIVYFFFIDTSPTSAPTAPAATASPLPGSPTPTITNGAIVPPPSVTPAPTKQALQNPDKTDSEQSLLAGGLQSSLSNFFNPAYANRDLSG